MVCIVKLYSKVAGTWMKMIEKVLMRRIRALSDFNDAQFGFMPVKATTDALFLVQRL